MEIKKALSDALGQIPAFGECAVLDYPNYFNIGDHLIWLGILSWLDERGSRVRYAASRHEFSARTLESNLKSGPIFLTGGGNFGDIWPPHQKFREAVISRFRSRPIIIMPQSVYFHKETELEASKKLLNSHPDLTILTRDESSYELAAKHFTGCKVLRCPDAAFQLAGLIRLTSSETPRGLLYHCRQDRESAQNFPVHQIGASQMVTEDWVSINERTRFLQKLIRKMPFLWHTGFSTPLPAGMRRRALESAQPWMPKVKKWHNPTLHQRSLCLMYAGIEQFSQYRFVVTNRLHGHILCVLLGIPHILLPNAYHKNRAFYSTWTSGVPYARFVDDPSKLAEAFEELGGMDKR